MIRLRTCAIVSAVLVFLLAASVSAADLTGLIKKAEQGHADAQFFLGRMYYSGRGVPQDYAEAMKRYRLAADQGDADAQFFLGGMYYSGRGVAQDYVQAHKWFNLAAASGHEIARKERDLLAKKMTPAQIAEAQKLAESWLDKQKKKKRGAP